MVFYHQICYLLFLLELSLKYFLVKTLRPLLLSTILLLIKLQFASAFFSNLLFLNQF